MWLGAQRALLLQLAHPSVAAAVEAHSAFRQRPHRRLWSTVDTMLLMVWGRPGEAVAAREHVHRIHDHVNGGLPDESPPWHAGDPYTAHDPALLRWVWSTLVDTADVVHARYVGALTPDQRDALYADWVTFAAFFGIPAEDLPPDRHAFAEHHVRERAALVVTPTARRLATDILDPPLWWAPTWLEEAVATIAVALLPTDICEGYGLLVDAAQEQRARRLERWIRRTYRHLPAARRRLPEAYLAGRRLVTSVSRVP